MADGRTFAFGEFLLFPERQLLMQSGRPVRLGGRALDLLTALVERPGELLSKTFLIGHAWPSTTVDESNLKVNMAALRRALEDSAGAAKYIATVTGRGYRFVAPVDIRSTPAARAVLDLGASMESVEPPSIVEHILDLSSKLDEILEARGCGVVIGGEMMLQFDDTTVLLKAGSVVAKRGCNHPIASHSGGSCRMLIVQFVDKPSMPERREHERTEASWLAQTPAAGMTLPPPTRSSA